MGLGWGGEEQPQKQEQSKTAVRRCNVLSSTCQPCHALINVCPSTPDDLDYRASKCGAGPQNAAGGRRRVGLELCGHPKGRSAPTSLTAAAKNHGYRRYVSHGCGRPRHFQYWSQGSKYARGAAYLGGRRGEEEPSAKGVFWAAASSRAELPGAKCAAVLEGCCRDGAAGRSPRRGWQIPSRAALTIDFLAIIQNWEIAGLGY